MKKQAKYFAAQGLIFLVMVLLVTGCDNPKVGNTNGSDTTAPSVKSGIDQSSFVYVPPGSFQRDSTETNISVISQGFLMARYPVTQGDFEQIMGTNPSTFSTGENAMERPVEFVNWYHAIAFANKLSIQRGLTPVYTVSGVDFATLEFANIPTASSNPWNNVTANWEADGYRLPTEMERLWAAMGATSGIGYPESGPYTTGFSKAFPGSSGTNNVEDYAWYSNNSQNSTHPVGLKFPNELDIYDLSGNVGEFVWDRNRTSANYPFGTLTDYRGNDDTSVLSRVVRGGNWGSPAGDLVIAGPNGLGFGARDPWTQSNSFGFRLVRNHSPNP